MEMSDRDFRQGRQPDSDETQVHVTPADIDRSVEVPVNLFVDVPKGMVLAPGAVVDDDGILRREETGELAIWHHRCKAGGHGPCKRYTDPTKFVQPEEVMYVSGAPWCPDCVEKMREDLNRERFYKGVPNQKKGN